MDYKYYFNFLFLMTKKEFVARYKNAFLGFLWAFFNPLLQMLIMGVVFQNFINIKTGTNNYFLYIFPGLLVWNFFSSSINKATSSLVWQRNLIQKAKFPREIIPISIILSNFFNFIISLTLLITFLVATGNIVLTLSKIGTLIVCFLWILSLTIGFSLLTSSLNVQFRDIGFLTQPMIMLWFYGSPIIYSLNSIPQKFMILFQINPLTTEIELMKNSLINTSLPNSNIIIANLLISLLIISLGITIFKSKSKNFSDWL